MTVDPTKIGLPKTAKKHRRKDFFPSNDGKPYFGVTSSSIIDTKDGKVILVHGTTDEERWCDPKYSTFMTYGHISGDKGPHLVGFKWDGKYWIRAIYLKNGFAVTRHPKQDTQSRKSVVIMYALYEVQLPSHYYG